MFEEVVQLGYRLHQRGLSLRVRMWFGLSWAVLSCLELSGVCDNVVWVVLGCLGLSWVVLSCLACVRMWFGLSWVVWRV